MGDLVAGQPALQIETAVSLPLDMVSVLSLLHRARPGSTLDPWLIAARAQLPPEVQADLDLLHGFSGRLLYYPEEPVMRFRPLDPERRDASFSDLIAFMHSLPAEDYRDMVAHALQRVHAGYERRWQPPHDEATWTKALQTARTSARLEDVLHLIHHPEELKRRTIRMYEAVWDHVYQPAREAELPMLRDAAERGAVFGDRGFDDAYAAFTGQRVPDVLRQPPPSITRVVFSPSAHLGGFVSYIAYEPDLIVFYSAPQLLDRCGQREPLPRANLNGAARREADPTELIEAARALADPTRLRIVDLLLEGELYAQEIVAKLGVAQSAASRHLAQLERAGVVSVQARRGSKYYAVNADRLESVAHSLLDRGAKAKGRQT